MKFRIALGCAALALLTPTLSSASAPAWSAPASIVDDDDLPKLSPFTAVETRLAEGTARVRVDDAWYELVSIDGLEVADILEHAQRVYGGRAEKRFVEDLVEVLHGMDHDPGEAVDLVLIDAAGETLERSDVAMTRANRQAVWTYLNARSTTPARGAQRAAAPERVEREHAARPAPAYAELAEPVRWLGWDAGARIERARLEQDLDQLEWYVRERYSYRDLNAVDVSAAFDAVRLSLADGLSREAFALQLTRLVGLFGDGHTRVEESPARITPRHWSPMLLGESEHGVVAFTADRSALLDPAHPYLLAIDGLELEHWLRAASGLSARGSAAFERRTALRNLRYLGYCRAVLGHELVDGLVVTLADERGERVELELPLARERPIYGSGPRRGEGELPAGVGYLRIERMDSGPAFQAHLRAVMQRHADAPGMIIDVRGNGGGSRDATQVLLPYFLDPAAGPRVVNVGAYRLASGEAADAAEGYLDNRALFPAASRRWDAPARRAIEAASAAFAPDWELPAGEFSDWHYMLVEPGTERFEGPLVVLHDTDCFSATDIFLGAFQGVPGVTLVGTPSGGGSGRSRGQELLHSGLSVRLSSMASFRPDGSRYDGKGVAPDVLVLPAPEDFLEGGGDRQLEAALELLLR